MATRCGFTSLGEKHLERPCTCSVIWTLLLEQVSDFTVFCCILSQHFDLGRIPSHDTKSCVMNMSPSTFYHFLKSVQYPSTLLILLPSGNLDTIALYLENK